METLLTQFAGIGALAIYIIVFFGMFIEGEMFLIVAGVLVHGHMIDYMDTILIAFAAVIVHDIGYWMIGTKLGRLERQRLWIVDMKRLERLFKKLKKREGLYIFMSKFAWGMNRFALLSSGYFQTSFKRLVKYTIPAAFIWTTTFISLGYVFADRAGVWKKDVRMVIMLAGALFVAMVYIEHQISRSIEEDVQLPDEDR